ncbi:MAG: bifunctional glutamate N-acetyltransferase/amino-acid acetyltransferase ArgJ [Granulosicoccaceae bacterium]
MNLVIAVQARNSSSVTVNLAEPKQADTTPVPVNLNLPPWHPVPGIALSSISAGIKSDGSNDMLLLSLPAGSRTASVFTQNAFCAAPVTVAREHLAHSDGQTRALLINSGNANAGTGEPGIIATRLHCDAVAKAMAIPAESVLPFSTGVIGELLDDQIMLAGVATAAQQMSDDWPAAARAIMTTDTVPKLSSQQIEVDGTTVTLTGMSKGAGMIQPNMATMLAYVFTDAVISTKDLKLALRVAVDASFNSITVDSDTSTNDACVLSATAQNIELSPSHPAWAQFTDALNTLCLDLAQAIVRDAEGATKFITVNVNGGRTLKESKTVAYAIANSPLVKTAMFASDANVGRLLMAVGKADVEGLDPEQIKVSIGNVLAFERGGIAAAYTEEQGAAQMAAEEISVHVELGRGDQMASVYTSDLSHDYVSINAGYRS